MYCRIHCIFQLIKSLRFVGVRDVCRISPVKLNAKELATLTNWRQHVTERKEESLLAMPDFADLRQRHKARPRHLSFFARDFTPWRSHSPR